MRNFGVLKEIFAVTFFHRHNYLVSWVYFFLTVEKSFTCFCQISVACSAPKYDSVADIVEKSATKQGQLTKVANRKGH